jgi:hypothetical protein
MRHFWEGPRHGCWARDPPYFLFRTLREMNEL